MRQTGVILEDIPEIPVTTDWYFGRGDSQSVIFFFSPCLPDEIEVLIF